MKVWISPADLCMLQSYKVLRDKLDPTIGDAQARRIYRLLAPLSTQLSCEREDATEVLLDVDPQVYQLLFALGACQSTDEEGGVVPLIAPNGTPHCRLFPRLFTRFREHRTNENDLNEKRKRLNSAIGKLRNSLEWKIDENTPLMQKKRENVWEAYLDEIKALQTLGNTKSSSWYTSPKKGMQRQYAQTALIQPMIAEREREMQKPRLQSAQSQSR